jgi:sec-independent protein translocase protein TatA
MAPLFGVGIDSLFSPMHLLILLVVGILVFGKRLPEIGRYLGKGIVEFKKGMKGLEDDFDGGTAAAPARPQEQQPVADQIRPPQRVAATAPKFEDSPNAITAPQNPTPRT